MIEDILKEYDLKVTEPRCLILKELINTNKPITAEELFLRIKDKKKINLSTIYRNLNILLSKEIILKVIEIDGIVYFQYNRKQHVHHLICVSCKEVIPLDSCPLEELESNLSNSTGYEILSHSLEFKGLCPKCKKTKSNH